MRFLILFLCLISTLSQAQIVTIPIPGAPGVSVTVGVGVNALPLQNINTNPAATNITTGDDNIVEVPLGFTFPFFGRNFTTSWAATNGYVTFQNPSQSGLGGGCCSGVDLTTTTNPMYNYTIYGMHTDLFSWNAANQWYLRENNAMTYGWYNLSQCCSSQGGNSFEIKITSAGTVDTRIAGALVNVNPVTSGMAGDLSKGEYYQYYHGPGLNILPGSANIFSWNTVGGFTGADPCATNPLSSPSCPGYAAAYLSQQCTISALYDPSCPGYAAANFTYQCSLNPLYSELCPGYAQAYFNQQCSINGLYDRNCPNYATAYATQQVLNKEQQSQSTPQSPQQTQQTAAVSERQEQSAGPSASPANVTTAVPLAKPEPQGPSPSSPVAMIATQQAGPPPPPPAQQQSSQPTTRAQQIQQARAEAAKKEAAAKGNENMKEAKGAKSMEQQVAVQGAIVAAMGYNPSFDVYTTLVMKDGSFYRPFEIYKNNNNVDNNRALRGLYGPSENRHQELINQQYK